MSVLMLILLPLMSAVVVRFCGQRWPKMMGMVACASVFGSFLGTLILTQQLMASHHLALSEKFLLWPMFDGVGFSFGLHFDTLSAVMCFLITAVGFLVCLYSLQYMKVKHFGRYFSYLNFFVAMMLLLVLSDQLLLLFVGWEGVGLASYLLIGFYTQDHQNGNAAKKAFILNRIGDLGFFLAMILIFGVLFKELQITSLQIADIELHLGLFEAYQVFGFSLVSVIGFLLFMAVVGKSAQIPLYMWLPDAMAGPTPVSAFIHAASMVTAGVYLMARLFFIFDYSATLSLVILIVGLVSALLGATIAIFQQDIKKVLAYSTISQLGYMVAACGLGAYSVAIFHVFTHGFFKALLFLCAGVIIRHMAGEQNITKMGGLKKIFPRTYWMFWIGSLSLAGIFPLAGFFSKDLILLGLFEKGPVYFGLGLLGVFCTSFYIFRLLNLVFEGPSRLEADLETKQLGFLQKISLVVLSVFCLLIGVLWLPDFIHVFQPFKAWLAHSVLSSVTSLSLPTEMIVGMVSLATAVLGIVLARKFYHQGINADQWFEKKFPDLYQLLSHQYYLDDLYRRAFVYREKRQDTQTVAITSSLIHFLSVIKGLFDRYLIDGLVHWFAWLPQFLGSLYTKIQNGQIQTYIRWITMGSLVFLFYWFLWMTGL